MISNQINNQAKWIDSGTVEYTIKDSINISPTIRVWILCVVLNLLHQYYEPSDQFGEIAALDSSYLVNYVVTDSFKEILVGTHIINYQSFIWQFPLNINMSESLVPFARYSLTTNPVQTYNFAYNSTGNTVEHISENYYQQFTFAKDTGLISPSYVDGYSSNVGAVSKVIKITLLSFS